MAFMCPGLRLEGGETVIGVESRLLAREDGGRGDGEDGQTGQGHWGGAGEGSSLGGVGLLCCVSEAP